MSEKGTASPQKVDARVRRTDDILGDALVALIREKPFDEITVQEVLDRAHVSRSTFYAHFRDKNDLFLSDVDDFFTMMANLLARRGEHSERVAPVRELFAHVAESKQFYSSLVASGKVRDMMDIGQEHFARGIEARLAEMSAFPKDSSVPRGVLGHALAGALLALLSWWIDHNMATPADEMDRIFHRMVWSGVAVNRPDTARGEGPKD